MSGVLVRCTDGCETRLRVVVPPPMCGWHGKPMFPVATPDPASPASGPGAPPNLCDACITGSHGGCTGVACYRCPDSYHDRRPGMCGGLSRYDGIDQ